MLTFAMRAAVGWVALTRWLPSNLVIAWLRTRSRLKWGVVVSLPLALGYFAVAVWFAWLVHDGAPGWVGIFSMVALVSAAKFAIFAPLSVVLPGRARFAERRLARA